MLKIIFIYISSTLIAVSVSAQSTSTLMGARVSGMARTSSCLSDEWSLLNNTGGLAKLHDPVAAFSQEVNPSFISFSKTTATIAAPLPYGVAGLSIFRFGDDLYNEQIISIGYGNTFGITSIGVKISYIQYRVDGFGRKGVLSVSIGGITQLTNRLTIGTYITNINQAKISQTGNEVLPTLLTAGLGLKASETVFITTEIEKDLTYDPTWKCGMEYVFNKKFAARTGFNINPDAFFIGSGFMSSRFKLDYAFQYTPALGNSHQASAAYTFKKKAK